jgi:L-fuconolactonase
MSIIDAHHHFWWMTNRPHSWPKEVGDRLDRDFTPDDLAPAMRAAGVDATVLTQSLNDYEETQEYLDLAAKTPWVRGVTGWIPLAKPEGVEPALQGLRNRDKLVSIRHLLRHDASQDWFDNPKLPESLAILAKHGIGYEQVPSEPAHFEGLLAIADKVPQLQIVICHLGRPPVAEKDWEPWASFITRCAERPNMAIKLSVGIAVLVTGWQWSTDELRRYSDHVLERFGAKRVLAASNWPVILLGGSYEEVWRGTTDLVSHLSPDERADVLGGTAERVYRLK